MPRTGRVKSKAGRDAMSSGTATGEAAHSGGKGAWAEDEVCWLKGSATANKMTVSATLDSGASLKVNASVQISLNLAKYSVTVFSMSFNAKSYNFKLHKIDGATSQTSLKGIKTALTALRTSVTTQANEVRSTDQKIDALITAINGMDLNT